MLKNFAIIILSFLILAIVWHFVLPASLVLSLLPQITHPPINYLTAKPRVSTLILTAKDLSLFLDIYKPQDKPRGSLIIFHAANEAGKDDPRLKRLAELFARTSFWVYVPTLPSLNRQTFHPKVLEEMKEVIKYAANENPKSPLKIMSFSIGVGPELIVASWPEVAAKVNLIAAFGGYADLENVVRYQTTEFFQEDGEFKKGNPPDPFGLWLFARYFAQFLPPKDAEIFNKIAERKRDDPEAKIGDLASALGPEGQAVLEVLSNKDPARTNLLLEKLPGELKIFQENFDPRASLKNLKSPVLLLHSQADRIIPFVESEKLFKELEQNNKQVQFIKLQIFDHVNPVLPALTIKNFFSIYLPEFWQLYKAAYRIIYLSTI